MLVDIREDLEQFGVVFDRWYSEQALAESGAIDRALARLEAQGRLYQQDGAIWFRASDFGDEKDRVVVRENGRRPTLLPISRITWRSANGASSF